MPELFKNNTSDNKSTHHLSNFINCMTIIKFLSILTKNKIINMYKNFVTKNKKIDVCKNIYEVYHTKLENIHTNRTTVLSKITKL